MQDEFPLRGPAFLIGDRVRIKKEVVNQLRHHKINGKPVTCNDVLTVETVMTHNIDNSADGNGTPYTDKFSYQSLSIWELPKSRFGIAADRFELAP